MSRIARALLSVHNKRGLVGLARALAGHGVELISTGGTGELLAREGLAVVRVSDFTGAPEILGGRVKTLHPRIAGGILARRGDPEHDRDARANDIVPIDLVVVNLYPFEETVARPGVTLAEAIENIDIGGPSLVRAAAKNHESVAVLVDPEDYAAFAEELDRSGGEVSATTRARLAVKAFEATAAYDAAVSSWLRRALQPEEPFGPTLVVAGGRKAFDLRYGENPHQRAAFYRSAAEGLGASQQLQGKELSYNNLLDLDAALALARDLGTAEAAVPVAVIVKHGNPCGAGRGDGDGGGGGESAAGLAEAYRRARAADPVSAFGGVVALSGEVDADTARELCTTFIEAVVAPGYAPEALELLAAKKALRVLAAPFAPPSGPVVRQVAGGYLVQDHDVPALTIPDARVVTKRAVSDSELEALRFAWVVAKHVKSNAVVFANQFQTVGIGAGQMSRVDSARLAAQKAVLPLAGTVAASDGFFPFRDGFDVVADAGAVAVIQPGGSVRDEEVIAAADERGVAMLMTGIRHFRH